MGEVDREAELNARKALIVIYILAIIAANVALLFKFLRQGQPLLSQRKFLIMTLAGGDILLALFPLVIQARLYYGDSFTLSCSTGFNAGIYWTYYLPFVYCVSLITLCGELCFRKKLRSILSNPYIASFALAAVPWIFGLVLVLPLTMAGFDTLLCVYEDNSFDRQRAMVVISVVIPAVLAVIFSFVTSSRNLDPVSESYRPPSSAGGVVLSQTSAPGFAQQPYYPPGQPQQPYYPPGQPQQQYYPPGQPQQQYYPPGQPQQQYYPPGQPQQQFYAPGQPYNPLSQPPPSYDQAQQADLAKYPSNAQQPQHLAPVVLQQAPAGAQEVASQQIGNAVRIEQRTLVKVSVINALLALPYALFLLGYVLNEDKGDIDSLALAVLTNLVLWLFYLRSIVTPLIWICNDTVIA